MHTILAKKAVCVALVFHLTGHLAVVKTSPPEVVKPEKDRLARIEEMLQLIMSQVSYHSKIDLQSQLERIEHLFKQSRAHLPQLQVTADRILNESQTIVDRLQTISTDLVERPNPDQEQLQTINGKLTDLNVSLVVPFQQTISLLNEAIANISGKLDTASSEQRQFSQQMSTLGGLLPAVDVLSQSFTSFWSNSSTTNEVNRQLLQTTVTSTMTALNESISARMQAMSSSVQSITSELLNLANLTLRHERSSSALLVDIRDQIPRHLTECPPEFTQLTGDFNSCYKPVVETLAWGVAAMKCRSLHKDAHLMFINSQNEQTAIRNFLTTNHGASNCGVWWTGGQRTDPSNNTPFVWKAPSKHCSVCGGMTEMTYTNWHPGEPNYMGNIESCFYMRSDGKWNDITCSNLYCSVCEVEMT